MGEITNRAQGNIAELLNLLNRALEIEYSIIIHSPRFASAIRDDETRKLALQLGEDSVHHADIVANAIIGLGGQPRWYFAPFPEGYDTLQIFQIQLGKEKEALELHRQVANLAPPGPLAESFAALPAEEERHIDTVNRIMSILTRS